MGHIVYMAKHKTNGRVYIGYTSLGLEARKIAHYRTRLSSKTIFSAALREGGLDAFEWSVLFESSNRESALTAEMILVEENSSHITGYNMRWGGEAGGGNHGPVNGMFGKTHTEHARRKIGLRQRGLSKGKTYEERYGAEKAERILRQRAEAWRGVDRSGERNARYDKEVRSFVRNDGESFTGTRYEFRKKYGINRSAVYGLIKGISRIRNGWRLA